MNTIKRSLHEILRYPSAIIGSVVVLLLVATAIYTLITIPYQRAIMLWRGGEDIWYKNPKFAPPEWVNFFSAKKLPGSFDVKTSDRTMAKLVTRGSQESATIVMTYGFDFASDAFPQEMMLYFNAKYDQKQPFVAITWITPDGRKINFGNFGVSHQQTYRFSQDQQLSLRLGGQDVMQGLFTNPKDTSLAPIKGKYQLVVTGVTFEKDADLDAEFVFQGLVFGLAGTDQARRDLVLPLLWGTPIALAFGLIASLGTSVLTMVIAAVGTWYGGWVDGLIQRVTEVNLVLPFLAILVMIGTLYSRSIWVILGATILLSIFTGSIKGYRAIFLQVKESTYIEAARAYGASSPRIIFLYLIPRMIPLLLPGLVQSVPAFVFLEATLAVLGLGDPVLPTWGKIINDAEANGALYKGLYYWILEPAALLMVTGLGFAMLGFALDRVFNPKLREI
jgi:peptide/nickel transport system permease protein